MVSTALAVFAQEQIKINPSGSIDSDAFARSFNDLIDKDPNKLTEYYSKYLANIPFYQPILNSGLYRLAPNEANATIVIANKDNLAKTVITGLSDTNGVKPFKKASPEYQELALKKACATDTSLKVMCHYAFMDGIDAGIEEGAKSYRKQLEDKVSASKTNYLQLVFNDQIGTNIQASTAFSNVASFNNPLTQQLHPELFKDIEKDLKKTVFVPTLNNDGKEVGKPTIATLEQKEALAEEKIYNRLVNPTYTQGGGMVGALITASVITGVATFIVGPEVLLATPWIASVIAGAAGLGAVAVNTVPIWGEKTAVEIAQEQKVMQEKYNLNDSVAGLAYSAFHNQGAACDTAEGLKLGGSCTRQNNSYALYSNTQLTNAQFGGVQFDNPDYAASLILDVTKGQRFDALAETENKIAIANIVSAPIIAGFSGAIGSSLAKTVNLAEKAIPAENAVNALLKQRLNTLPLTLGNSALGAIQNEFQIVASQKNTVTPEVEAYEICKTKNGSDQCGKELAAVNSSNSQSAMDQRLAALAMDMTMNFGQEIFSFTAEYNALKKLQTPPPQTTNPTADPARVLTNPQATLGDSVRYSPQLARELYNIDPNIIPRLEESVYLAKLNEVKTSISEPGTGLNRPVNDLRSLDPNPTSNNPISAGPDPKVNTSMADVKLVGREYDVRNTEVPLTTEESNIISFVNNARDNHVETITGISNAQLNSLTDLQRQDLNNLASKIGDASTPQDLKEVYTQVLKSQTDRYVNSNESTFNATPVKASAEDIDTLANITGLSPEYLAQVTDGEVTPLRPLLEELNSPNIEPDRRAALVNEITSEITNGKETPNFIVPSELAANNKPIDINNLPDDGPFIVPTDPDPSTPAKPSTSPETPPQTPPTDVRQPTPPQKIAGVTLNPNNPTVQLYNKIQEIIAGYKSKSPGEILINEINNLTNGSASRQATSNSPAKTPNAPDPSTPAKPSTPVDTPPVVPQPAPPAPSTAARASRGDATPPPAPRKPNNIVEEIAVLAQKVNELIASYQKPIDIAITKVDVPEGRKGVNIGRFDGSTDGTVMNVADRQVSRIPINIVANKDGTFTVSVQKNHPEDRLPTYQGRTVQAGQQITLRTSESISLSPNTKLYNAGPDGSRLITTPTNPRPLIKSATNTQNIGDTSLINPVIYPGDQHSKSGLANGNIPPSKINGEQVYFQVGSYGNTGNPHATLPLSEGPNILPMNATSTALEIITFGTFDTSGKFVPLKPELGYANNISYRGGAANNSDIVHTNTSYLDDIRSRFKILSTEKTDAPKVALVPKKTEVKVRDLGKGVTLTTTSHRFQIDDRTNFHLIEDTWNNGTKIAYTLNNQYLTDGTTVNIKGADYILSIEKTGPKLTPLKTKANILNSINPKIKLTVNNDGTSSFSIPQKGNIDIGLIHNHEFGKITKSVNFSIKKLLTTGSLEPIKVTIFEGKIYTIDGANRIRAYIENGIENVPYEFSDFNGLENPYKIMIREIDRNQMISGTPVPSFYSKNIGESPFSRDYPSTPTPKKPFNLSFNQNDQANLLKIFKMGVTVFTGEVVGMLSAFFYTSQKGANQNNQSALIPPTPTAIYASPTPTNTTTPPTQFPTITITVAPTPTVVHTSTSASPNEYQILSTVLSSKIDRSEMQEFANNAKTIGDAIIACQKDGNISGLELANCFCYKTVGGCTDKTENFFANKILELSSDGNLLQCVEFINLVEFTRKNNIVTNGQKPVRNANEINSSLKNNYYRCPKDAVERTGFTNGDVIIWRDNLDGHASICVESNGSSCNTIESNKRETITDNGLVQYRKVSDAESFDAVYRFYPEGDSRLDGCTLMD